MESSKDIEPLHKKIKTETDNHFPLAQLPKDTLREVGQYLFPIEQDILGRMGNKNLFFAFLPGSLAATKQLLLYVVHGKKKEAEEMLKHDPCLLLSKATVTDYSGRKIHGTAWQIAAGAEDVSINMQRYSAGEINQHEEMLEMIERYFRTLPNNEIELAKQKAEQFPEGWEEIEKEREMKDSEALNKVFKAIAHSNTDQDCQYALDEFKNHLRPKGIITTGKHFNAQLLVEAWSLYNQNYKLFARWEGRQNKLAWSEVVGEIEFNLPACYAQSLCDGIYNVADVKRPLTRGLMLNNGWAYYEPDVNAEVCRSYYHRNVNAKVGLGLSFAVYSYRVGATTDRCCDVEMGWGVTCKPGRVSLENYIKEKQAYLAERLNLDIPQRHQPAV